MVIFLLGLPSKVSVSAGPLLDLGKLPTKSAQNFNLAVARFHINILKKKLACSEHFWQNSVSKCAPDQTVDTVARAPCDTRIEKINARDRSSAGLVRSSPQPVDAA